MRENLARAYEDGAITDEDLEKYKTIGKLLFTEDDISETSSILDRSLRRIFVSNKITFEYFKERYKRYHPNKTASDMGNLISSLKKGNITFNRFEEAVNTIGLTIGSLLFQLKSSNGDTQIIKYESE